MLRPDTGSARLSGSPFRSAYLGSSPASAWVLHLSTLALDASSRGRGGSLLAGLLRYLDLVVLAAALPLFVLAGFPIAGYVGSAIAWLAQRGVSGLAASRIAAGTDRKTALGIIGGSIVARLWLVTLAILLVGLAVSDEAGLAAALLAAALVTVNLAGEAVLRLGTGAQRR